MAGVNYSAFGKITSATPSGIIPRFCFTGREFDSETGLIFYRARYYSPDIGRFVTQDPQGLNETEVNLYRYVNNSPVNFTDPLGLQLALEYTQQTERTTEYAAPAAAALGFAVGCAFTRVASEVAAIVGFDLPVPPVFKNCKACSPCKPFPAGTTGYRFDTGHSHYPCSDPHLHLFIVNQVPWPVCKCFWNKDGCASPPPMPDWVPSPLPPLSN